MGKADQFAAYATFLSASQNELFHPGQALSFSGAYFVVSLVALVASVPFWQALGLIR